MTHPDHRAHRLGVLLGIALAVFISAPAAAHVGLDAPNGGASLEVGSTYTIQWHVLIEHNLENWDLWYSTTGPKGPWIPIATDLDAGDSTAGAVHTYEWTVPDDVGDDVWVRVRQDNMGTDYYDISDDANSITPAPCSGDANGDAVVNVADLLAVINNWGTDGTSGGDVTGDSVVNVADLLEVINHWGDEC